MKTYLLSIWQRGEEQEVFIFLFKKKKKTKKFFNKLKKVYRYKKYLEYNITKKKIKKKYNKKKITKIAKEIEKKLFGDEEL